MKFCHKCGSQCEDGAKFCKQCGAALVVENNDQNDNTYSAPQNEYSEYSAPQNEYNEYSAPNNDYNTSQNNYGGVNGQTGGIINSNYPGIENRNIAVAIILSIVTCGIYSIYWMFKMNDEMNQLAGDYQAPSGGMVVLLTLVTCGIYGWYWLYKMGEKCDQVKGMNGSSGVLYLILGIVGLSIISYCLIQDTINKTI